LSIVSPVLFAVLSGKRKYIFLHENGMLTKKKNFGPRPQQYFYFLTRIHRPLPRHVFEVRTVVFNLQQTHFKTYGKIYSLLKVFVYGEYISDQDQIAYIPLQLII